ncbi:MAG: hypothetical protein DCC67_02595 [Planctomycetota bacterium]|nr:MAG: hypothetical protein DCC67_02595 [Planctomycetota bacterium]
MGQPQLYESMARISDCGVALHACDEPPAAAKPPLLEQGESASLRRLQRKLRPVGRFDNAASDSFEACPTSGLTARGDGSIAGGVQRLESRTGHVQRERPAWAISLLLGVGGIAVTLGFLLLVAANMLLNATTWRWGFAIVSAGEALLVAGLAAMAVRLWRNSRRLNLQIEGLDRRLEVVQSTLVQPSLAPSRRSASVRQTPPLRTKTASVELGI